MNMRHGIACKYEKPLSLFSPFDSPLRISSSLIRSWPPTSFHLESSNVPPKCHADQRLVWDGASSEVVTVLHCQDSPNQPSQYFMRCLEPCIAPYKRALDTNVVAGRRIRCRHETELLLHILRGKVE
jgi:hypothetical protein